MKKINEHIEVIGAREHNLKNFDLSIPKNQLVVFTGVSGSGKSTLAQQIKFNGVICNADAYFTKSNGVYEFDASKLDDAHNECRQQAENAMINQMTPVIIDNTNLKIWEFKQYIQMVILI